MVIKMNKKTINIIGTIFIFLIGFILHNLYNWFPNFLTLIISPVAESMFEHLKMIFTSYMLWLVIKYFIYKRKNIKENSFFLKEVITALFEILIFSVIYYPIYKVTGENIIITLSIYLITIIVSQILNYYIYFKNDSKTLNTIGIALIFITYAITTYLTYKPPICDFFLDPTNNSYGINK